MNSSRSLRAFNLHVAFKVNVLYWIPTYLPIYLLSIYLSIYLSVYLSIYPSIHLSIYPFLSLTTPKTKQFCDCDFFNFELGNIKNKATLRDFLQNGKLSAELRPSYQCVLHFFQSTCQKYCACHEKVRPGHTKCCTCHAKSSQQT